jgi:hypothetical protein
MQPPIVGEVLGLIHNLNRELVRIEAHLKAGRISPEDYASCKRALIHAGNELCAIFDVVSDDENIA